MLHDYLTAADGLCGTYGDRGAVSHLFEEHESGQFDANLALWTLFSAEIWYRDVYLARRGRTVRSVRADVA